MVTTADGKHGDCSNDGQNIGESIDSIMTMAMTMLTKNMAVAIAIITAMALGTALTIAGGNSDAVGTGSNNESNSVDVGSSLGSSWCQAERLTCSSLRARALKFRGGMLCPAALDCSHSFSVITPAPNTLHSANHPQVQNSEHKVTQPCATTL